MFPQYRLEYLGRCPMTSTRTPACAASGDGDLPLRARAQNDLAFPCQCLRGIAHDIEQRLYELLRVARKYGMLGS